MSVCAVVDQSGNVVAVIEAAVTDPQPTTGTLVAVPANLLGGHIWPGSHTYNSQTQTFTATSTVVTPIQVSLP